jgi:hypothetical protein
MKRNHSRHYCRKCAVIIQPTHERHPSAHYLSDLHNRTEHGTERQVACTKHCAEAAQPEEIRAKEKLYGFGAKPLPKPIMTYDQLFPDVEDDHS